MDEAVKVEMEEETTTRFAPGATDLEDDTIRTLGNTASMTQMIPGDGVPDDTVIQERITESAANTPQNFIFKEMRLKTSKPKKKKSKFSLGNLLCFFIPRPIENAAIYTGKEALKGAVDLAAILQSVLSLDPVKVRNELRAIIRNFLYQDLSKYEYNIDTGKLPGRLTSREMIYCARLSMLAYVTRNVSYSDFFAEYRENEILDPAFEVGGANELSRYFLVSYIASLFEQDKSSPRFGYSKGIADGLDQMNLELVYPFDIDHNQGFIAKSKDFDTLGGDLVISFQGTVERADVITSFKGSLTPFEPLFDMNGAGACANIQGTLFGCCLNESAAQKAARKNDKPNGRVHLGFYEAFLSVRPTIQATLEAVLKHVVPTKRPVRIVVTGHSLGGALACLTTAWLMQWFRYVFPGGLPENFRVLSITFGQPKVGDSDFVNAIDRDEWTNWTESKNAVFKTYRIFTPSDPVVTTPPVALGFRHCYAMCLIRDGHLFFLPQSMANEVDTTSEGLRRAIDQGLAVLHFHDLFNYLGAVMQFADLTRGDEDMDQVFGTVDYQADVRKDDFLRMF